MCRTGIAGIVLALLMSTGPAAAADRFPPTMQAELMARIVDWIVRRSDLPRPPRLPDIERATRGEMAAMRYGAEAVGIRTVEALYHPPTATIFLPPDWTGSTPAEMSVLVHEMVHHLQDAAGVIHACPGAAEASAYHIQDLWLAEAGTDLRAAFQIDRFTLLAMTACVP